MRKFLYFCMLIIFFVCIVVNALTKKDSILGTGPFSEDAVTKQSDGKLAAISKFLN